MLLSADFLTKEIWTFCGLQTAYVLLVMHLKTRTVILCEATLSPNGRWMSQMARNAMMTAEDLGIRPKYVLHDRDFLFSHHFDPALRAANMKVIKTPFRSPNLNAHCERHIRSVKAEVLDHLIIFGLDHLKRVLDRWKHYHSHCRPHQGLGQRKPDQVLRCVPLPQESNTPITPEHVECTQYLGGLLRSHSREDA